MKTGSLRLARLDAIVKQSPSPFLVCSRSIHSSSSDKASLAASSSASSRAIAYPPPTAPSTSQDAALACLPLSTVLRTYLMTAVSSSPALLGACSAVLTRMLESKSFVTDIERNPVLRLVLRETFYKQYCAGSNKAEVTQTKHNLQAVGYDGVILEHALEMLKEDLVNANEEKDVAWWVENMLTSIEIAAPGDFLGVKWSGLGTHALQRLKAKQQPSPLMDKAIRQVCDAAAAKGVRLLPAAEETTTTPTIDEWSMAMQRVYNRGRSAVIYNTYQCYLKSTAGQISKHLAMAKADGHILGLKLVRGAYLHSEPRHLIWPTIESTHNNYDSITASLLKRKYTETLQPVSGNASEELPEINVVLATHNATTVRKAQALRTEQIQNGEELVPLAYGQLQGMADEVSCELLQASKGDASDKKVVDVPKVFKCSCWGTMKECLNYLLRRAAENKDAATRTRETRLAMGGELRKRMRAVFGLA